MKFDINDLKKIIKEEVYSELHGLDSHIMGLHDPNAPINQVDWSESYASYVVDKCDWITDEMVENEKVYDALGKIFGKIIETHFNNNKIYSNTQKFHYTKANADKLANEFTLKCKQKLPSLFKVS
jgi:hypothetical protein